MTHTKASGESNSSLTACFLATGSASETIKGISHLFEHLILENLYLTSKGSIVNGYTTEDYVFLTGNIKPRQIMENLHELKFEETELDLRKNQLKEEIRMVSSDLQEFFFRFIWEGTSYEKSPLGAADHVDTITPSVMETFKRRLLTQSVYFYTREEGIKIIKNEAPKAPLILPEPLTWKKNRVFRDRAYDIFYFNSEIEAFYLVERILKLVNPGKHIQLSEKRGMSALILEKGTVFPTGIDIAALQEEALTNIKQEIEGIKKNFNEQALNELESAYFYGDRWEKRIDRLFKTGFMAVDIILRIF